MSGGDEMSYDNRRVLILEDDPQTLALLIDYLRAPLIDIVACSEIEAAECLMDREQFDVLVTDLEVSELGGLEAIRLIRHVTCHFPKTSVIVFSGNINLEVRALGKALGVLELLDKPGGLKRLRELIDDGLPIQRDSPDCQGGKVTRVENLGEVLADRSITGVLQPIVALDSGVSSPRVFGVEGLSRGPEGSLLKSPEILLDYASRKELLFEAEMQCIEAVLTEGCYFKNAGKLFINIRPRSLSQTNFAASLRNLVRRHGYEETDIVLELTEQQSILNLQAFDRSLRALHDSGFGLALDDYGSGFANLHLVQQLHLDYVKIDGLFCMGIHENPRKQAIVRSTVEMAKDLGIETVMERVETEEELNTVRDLGVTYAQGYFFSAPVPGRELAASFQPAARIPVPQPVATDFNDHDLALVKAVGSQVEHDLANVITSIALFAHQGMRRTSEGDPLREDLERICAASEEAVELAERLHEDLEPDDWSPVGANGEEPETLGPIG
jgi:EAL domain-containing protein (putative c-di-GMP-specific phosphodiesterase class I)